MKRFFKGHKSGRWLILLIVAGVLATGCSGGQALTEKSDFLFSTIISFRLYLPETSPVYTQLFDNLKGIEKRMSSQITTSEIAQINQNAGVAPVKVSDDTFKIIQRGLYYAKLTNGQYDPTIYPVVSLWGITTDNPKVPKQTDINDALVLVNWQDLVLDEDQKTVFLKRKGMGIDLGSIAKGYAADSCADLLKKQGIQSGIINLGGNIFALGSKSDGKPWRVGVQDPFKDRGNYMGVVSATNQTVVTSGIYERYFEANGKKYHHIFDTKTGYPKETDVMSVTILADKSFDADGRTLCCFVLGPDKGMAFAKEQGVEVMYVMKNKKIYCSDGFKKVFELTDTSFSIQK